MRIKNEEARRKLCKEVLPHFLETYGWLDAQKEVVDSAEFEEIMEALAYAVDRRYIENIKYHRNANGKIIGFTSVQTQLVTPENEAQLAGKRVVTLTEAGKNFLDNINQ